MAARVAGSLHSVTSEETEQELQTGNLAVAGVDDGTPSGQTGIILDLERPVGNKCNLGSSFQQWTWGQGLVDRGSEESTGQPQTLVRNKRAHLS